MQEGNDNPTPGAKDAPGETEHATLIRKFHQVLSGQLKMSASAYMHLVQEVNAAGGTGVASPEDSHVSAASVLALKV